MSLKSISETEDGRESTARELVEVKIKGPSHWQQTKEMIDDDARCQ